MCGSVCALMLCPFLCSHARAQCACTALQSDGQKGVKAASASREVVDAL